MWLRYNQISGFRLLTRFLQNKIRYCNEALAAVKSGGGNARALRRAAKRHDSLATATPFVVATIGFCDAFLYCKGVLCYTLDDRVRILDLHRSAKSELVISIPGLLTQALPAIGENSRGVFLILYYSDHIISCLYKSEGPDSTAWLIAFHLKGVILAVQELESTDKIFVRHNKQYLYYGTHSEIGTDGYKKWVISGYDFRTRKWFDKKIHLPDMVGSEIGSTICFEFYEGFFYALSNQTSFEVEEIDWTSFYHCIRFPLNSPCKDLLQKTENKSMWRRQHQEGPIDDRWTSLRLDVDESTGKLRIVEARKEWYLGSSRSQRTYYTTDIKFPPPKDDDLDLADLPAPATTSEADFTFPSTSSWVPASTTLSEAATSSESSSTSSDTSTSASSSSSASTSTSLDSQGPDSLPDVPLLRLLAKDDHPHHIEAPARIPENTHPGNDGSTQPTFTLAKSRIRTYHTSCNTFLDLVDDPLPDDWQGIQRLRLRAGTRRLGPPLLDSNRLLRSPPADLEIALAEMYIVPEIAFWPPPQDPNPENRDKEIEKIYRLLNPPSHLGNVEGMADERSLVYVTGGESNPQALIFVSFDPAIKLEGLKKWGGLYRKGAKGYGFGFESGDENKGKGKRKEKSVYVDMGEADRTVRIDRKGKGKGKAGVQYCNTQIGGHAAVGGVGGGNVALTTPKVGAVSIGGYNWAWKEEAMYQDINLGFYFGLDRPSES